MGKPISYDAKKKNTKLTSWGFGVVESRGLTALERQYLEDNFSEPSDYEKRVCGEK